MARHRWKKEDNGFGGEFFVCIKCGIIKEKHFGLAWEYFDPDGNMISYGRAPKCLPSKELNEVI
jgi:hypothetical protein